MTNVGYAHGMVHLTTSKKRRSKFYPNWTKPYNSRAHCRADNKTSGAQFLMDGTFKIVSFWYQQLFTLHLFMSTVVYCLTVRKDLPSNSQIFEVLHSKAEELGIELAPTKFVCDFETALIPTIQGNYLSIFSGEPCIRGFRNLKSQMEVLFEYFQREWLPTTKIPLWNIHGVALRTNNHLEGWHSRKNYGARE
ncbi:hypothetical protein T03_10153 [Trichinella britovi]|uniref:MULE transposase domain-containing protein n=1 Tax=Trichinella britovi TaxID=45882 RepID=A0A0V1C8H2_TRIBR|nr:hypothetical protein T03_10153 [Trichinella britovi]